MSREKWIKHIRKAYAYSAHARNMASCSHLYMGGMSQHRLDLILGVSAPFPRRVLESPSDEKLFNGVGIVLSRLLANISRVASFRHLRYTYDF